MGARMGARARVTIKTTGGSGFHKKNRSISEQIPRILEKNTGGSGFHKFFQGRSGPESRIWLRFCALGAVGTGRGGLGPGGWNLPVGGGGPRTGGWGQPVGSKGRRFGVEWGRERMVDLSTEDKVHGC